MMKRMLVFAMLLAGALVYADAVLAHGPGSGAPGAVSYTHLTLPTIYSV